MTEEEFEKAKQMAKEQMDQMCKDILSVKPMDEAGKAFYQLWEATTKHGRSREELIADGYKPVSRIELL
jgi:hypothetical protein